MNIVKSAKDKECSCIIIAWGHGSTSKKIVARQNAVLKLLLPYKDKLMTLEDERGKKGMHPLTPSLRNCWTLAKFEMPDLTDDPPKPESESKKKRKNAKKQDGTQKPDERPDADSDTQNEDKSEQTA